MRPEVISQIEQWYEPHLASRSVILELGGQDVNGSPRRIFAEGEHLYTCVDMRDGDGVDIVANAHDLTIDDESVDLVLCLDMFEHDSAFWETLREVKRVLVPGGGFLLGVPTIYFPTFHQHPKDYWRFTTDSFYEILMDGFFVVDKAEITTPGAAGADTLIAIATKQ